MTLKSERAKEICLGLFGADAMPDHVLSDSVTWQNGDCVLIGQDAVLTSIKKLARSSVKIEDVVTHGKAAAVSGRLITNQGPFLFCHMIKFTNTSAKQIASIVSFKHKLKEKG